jgi:drug/metabolite transporter (DMT)-like permease
MTRKMNDKCALMLAALVCFGLMMLMIAFARPRVSGEWARFIYMSVGYMVLLVYVVSRPPFKQLPKLKIFLFQAIYYTLTTGVAFAVFRYGLIPLPGRMIEYTLPIIVLAMVSVFVLQYLMLRLKFFKNNGEVRRKRL